MRAVLIGCGLIGKKRARFLQGCSLVACADPNFTAAQELAGKSPSARPFADWREMIDRMQFDVAIVATPHSVLHEAGQAALAKGAHLFLEKPGAISSRHLAALNQGDRVVRLGYNHRFHRALQKAKEIVDRGDLGELMYVRGRYGHGGRIGYDQEWRADPVVSGGGELIDQGVHLIDLSRWFLGDFVEVDGFAHTYFWSMPVEDNGFLLMKTVDQKVAFLHASCTEWKNLFSFEIYGKQGKLAIEGLGGSYGVERLSYYKMAKAMGPPETQIWEYPMEDNSWAVEWSAFLKDIHEGTVTGATLEEGVKALEAVEAVYSKTYYKENFAIKQSSS
jgi:predicted dehydrogenase